MLPSTWLRLTVELFGNLNRFPLTVFAILSHLLIRTQTGLGEAQKSSEITIATCLRLTPNSAFALLLLTFIKAKSFRDNKRIGACSVPLTPLTVPQTSLCSALSVLTHSLTACNLAGQQLLGKHWSCWCRLRHLPRTTLPIFLYRFRSLLLTLMSHRNSCHICKVFVTISHSSARIQYLCN